MTDSFLEETACPVGVGVLVLTLGCAALAGAGVALIAAWIAGAPSKK